VLNKKMKEVAKKMKKVINGSVFNTETAKLLGEFQHSYCGQFDYILEELYKTRSGKYFIYVEGGAQSKYAVQVSQNTWSGSEKIIPIQRERAMAWVEEYLDGDTYIEIFGAPSEVEQKIMTFSLDTNVESLLRAEQEKTGKNLSDIVSELVVNNLK